jgi:thiol-disulfide isomerase/thioredoxin
MKHETKGGTRMNFNTRHTFTLSIIVLIFLICPNAITGAGMLPGGGDKLITFAFENIVDGKVFNVANVSGKAIFLNFGSRYCKPCKEMVSELNKLQERFKGAGLVVVKVDIDNEPDKEAMKSFATDMKIQFPYLVGNRDISKQYGVIIVPTSYLVDKNHTIVKKYLGFQPANVIETDYNGLPK